MLNLRCISDNQNHPSNPKEGDLFYDKNTNEFKVYHNNQWYAYYGENVEYNSDYYLLIDRKNKIKKIRKIIKKNES